MSRTRRFLRVLAGVVALTSLVAIFFLLLNWRTNTPERHLNLGDTPQFSEQTDE